MHGVSPVLRGRSTTGWFAALAATLLVSQAAFGAAPAAVVVVRPDGPPLTQSPGFSFSDESTRQSASGIACVTDGARRHCLVAFDEGVKAQFANLAGDALTPVGDPIGLLPPGGELDAEGAATDGTHFYVVGSHSVKRKSCRSNEASRHLIRFKASWPPASAPSGNSAGPVVSGLQATTALWERMLQEPYLAAHADGCLGSTGKGRKQQEKRKPGLNIEGLAAMGGRLYLGFRGPSEAGVVPLYSIEAAALFDGTAGKPRLEKLQVGTHLGIRDMVAGTASLLLLIGPDDDDPPSAAQWQVAEWQDKGPGDAPAQPRVLATLDSRGVSFNRCFKALKPEAISILEESATRYRILVLSDGVCDGGALVFNVPR